VHNDGGKFRHGTASVVEAGAMHLLKSRARTSQDAALEQYSLSRHAADFTKSSNRETRRKHMDTASCDAKLLRARPYNCSNLLMLYAGFLSR
jgi:hypothetical protein